MKNIAYIDGQNLFMGTTRAENPWKVDLQRFRVYLEQQYQVDRAYYYLGYVQDGDVYQSLYEEIDIRHRPAHIPDSNKRGLLDIVVQDRPGNAEDQLSKDFLHEWCP